MHRQFSRAGNAVAAACLAACAAALVPASVRAQSLESMLKRGPLVLVEQDDKGGFKGSTAIAHFPQSVEKVWEVLVDVENYVKFMPKLLKSEVKERTESSLVATYEIEVPGPNTNYSMKYTFDRAKWAITSAWHAGDLKDTRYTWLLKPQADGSTIVYYKGITRNFSAFVENLEDDQQTLTIGVNVSSSLAVIKAIRSELMRRHAVADAGKPAEAAKPTPTGGADTADPAPN